MSKGKKPRKAHRPKSVNSQAMNWAIAGSCTLPKHKQVDLMAPVDAALRKLQLADADRDDWNTLANALNLAEALCGLQIGTNLMPKFKDGMDALHDVALRMLGGARSTCKGPELAAITEALDMYRIQLRLCTQAEMSRAAERVGDMHRSGAMLKIEKIYQQMDLAWRAA